MKTRLLCIFGLLFLMMIPANAKTKQGEGLKSAIIQYEMMTNGNAISMTQYSDDYGNQLCMKMFMMGIEVATITRNDTVYVLNYAQKSGVKYVRPETDINYNALTPELIAKYKIEAQGIEEVLGKKCTKYTARIVNEDTPVEVITWVYKGVVLKSVAEYGGDKRVEMVATSLEENPEVSEETFMVPSDFVIRAM